MLIWNHQGFRILVIPCSTWSGAFIEEQENEHSTDVEPLGIFQAPPGNRAWRGFFDFTGDIK